MSSELELQAGIPGGGALALAFALSFAPRPPWLGGGLASPASRLEFPTSTACVRGKI